MKHLKNIIHIVTLLITTQLLIACSSAELDAVDYGTGARDKYFYDEDNVIEKKLSTNDLEKIVQEKQILNTDKLNNSMYIISLFNGNSMSTAVESYKQDYFMIYKENITTYKTLQLLSQKLNQIQINTVTANNIMQHTEQLEKDVYDDISKTVSSLNGEWQITDKNNDDGDGVIANKILDESRYTINVTDSIKATKATAQKYIKEQTKLATRISADVSYSTFLNNYYKKQNQIEANRVKNNHPKTIGLLLDFTTHNNKLENDVNYYINAYAKAIAQGSSNNEIAIKEQKEKQAEFTTQANKTLMLENEEIDKQNEVIKQHNAKISEYKNNHGRPICDEKIISNCILMLKNAKVIQVNQKDSGILVQADNDLNTMFIYLKDITRYHEDEVISMILQKEKTTYTYTANGVQHTIAKLSTAPEIKFISLLKGFTKTELTYISSSTGIPTIPHKTLRDIETHGIEPPNIISIEAIKNKAEPDFDNEVLNKYNTKIYN